MNKKLKDKLEGTFKLIKMSPKLYKLFFGEYPKVSSVKEADMFGLTKKELEDMK